MFQRKVGGSRSVNIKKNAYENDIKYIALPLFFPGGKSHIGHKHDFAHRIGNFRGEPLLDNFSLTDYIREHKLTYVQLYLLSKKKTSNNRVQNILDKEFSDSDDFEPEKFLNPFSANPDHEESVNEKASDEQTKSTLCMKCFSTKRDKECLKCMQDKEYDHSLKVGEEKKKTVVEIDDEVSLKVNRSYEVEKSFIREQRKAKLPAKLGLSDKSTVVAIQHIIKGRLTRFCHPD